MTSPKSPTKAYSNTPPLRSKPFDADEHDSKRVEWVRGLWHSQDVPLRLRDRQIEENVRMLCGQQWCVWSDTLGRFLDASQLLSSAERRWRQRPVVNKLLDWYVLTHARLTENPPTITFLPRSGDRFDAELAEVSDIIFKAKWDNCGMLEVLDRMVAWLIPGGRAYIKTRIDPARGDLKVWRGPGVLSLLDADGAPVVHPVQGTPIEAMVEDAAYDADGTLLSRLNEDGTYEDVGEAHAERTGDLAVDVISPLEVRSEWGENIPFHEKRWHIHRSFMSPEAVYDTWGVEVEPDTTFSDATGPGELQRLMMGSGFYGASNSNPASEMEGAQPTGQGWVSVYEYWEKPGKFQGTQETESSPGGRLTIIAGNTCVRDGVRIARFPYTSPIRCFDFVNLPGRPGGTSPQEAMNPVQRAFNRVTGQILQHTNLCTNPKALIDQASGIQEGQWTNEPDTAFVVTRIPGNPAIEYVVPPPLSDQVFEARAMLGQEIREMGRSEGAEGRAPTRDSSGELVKELRSNSDRPIASTARRAVLELGRWAEDVNALMPLIMDEETVISYAGEDNVTRSVTVFPELFKKGSVNVRPDIESMLPEGRGERQTKVRQLYLDGAFGQPGAPDAVRTYLERSRFPHMGREALPGGIHRITANHINGKLVRGITPDQIEYHPWYNHQVHLEVLVTFMSSPEWVRLDEEIKIAFQLHMQRVQMAAAEQMAQQAAAQASMMAEADDAAASAADGTRELPAQESPEPQAVA